MSSGCNAPSAANIALRKTVQEQQTEIDRLNRQHAADVASMKAWQPATAPSTGPAAAPALSSDEAASAFTTHGIRLGRLTRPTDTGLVVHLIPTDDTGDDFKAAGAIIVEAFDLSSDAKRVGRWPFSVAEAKALWNGNALRYEYVLTCPWTEKPSAKDLTLKVNFVDALTGRSFDTQQVIRTKPE